MFAPGHSTAATADICGADHALAASRRTHLPARRSRDAVAAPPFGSVERFPMVHSPLERFRTIGVPADF